jgi:hypothetical protein
VAGSVHADTPNNGEPGHNQAGAPYTTPVDSSRPATRQVRGPQEHQAGTAFALAGDPLARTWKLQELPSSQFRNHLAGRRARKGPHAGAGLGRRARPPIQLAAGDMAWQAHRPGCRLMAWLACALLKGVPGG